MVQLLAFRKGKTLETFISKFPTKQFDNDEEFTWDEQNVLLLSN